MSLSWSLGSVLVLVLVLVLAGPVLDKSYSLRETLISTRFSDVNKDWTCKDKDNDKDLTHKDQDKDKYFTYRYLLQVAAKPTIVIKQQQ